jgi:hypothetical protein
MYELMLMTTKTPSLRINDLINVNLSLNQENGRRGQGCTV